MISQIYGGGGNSGALYTNDFVELFNPTGASVTFVDWSVQYAAAGGATWDVSVLTGTHVLAPGQYFLVQEARGSGGSQSLPPPDSTGSINLNATAGKVALVRGATALTCGSACHADPQVADFVGYGPSANDYEGSGPAPAPDNPSSALRGGDGCADTDDNAADFAVADPPLPRNSADPPHLCSGGPSPTATATPTPRVTPAVEIAMLYAYGLTTATPQPDEAVRLANVSAAPVAVGGWQVRVESGAAVTLPLTATLAPGAQIWIADTATGFRPLFGRNPDYEYGGDTDPAVPQATADPGFTFADSGGAVQLYDSTGALQDTLVYGSGDPGTAGWSGPAVGYYRPPNQPAFRYAGQIFYRKIDEVSGLPVADTDTKDDWAQDDDPAGTSTPVPGDRENDDVSGKKLLHPGWPLTDPDAAALSLPQIYTETNVTTEFLVEPDNGYLPIHNLLISATQAITIETYEWHAAPLVQDVIAAHARGVQVSVILDGNPCCTQRPDDETLWSAQQWEAAGIPVYFFSGTPATGEDTYRYDNTHAKILVVDGRWVVTGADNFALSALTTDPRDNGTAGERGALILTDAPDVVAATLRLIAFDFAPGRFADVVRYPALGTPPPGYSPTPFPDMTGYTPIKPTPLVVTETEQIAIVQAPETGLRDLDGLIGLVDRAGPGDTVLVEQQYERTYWETSPSDGPNPRLAAYIRAAQRGATVRILLDGFFEGGDCSSSTHNPATVAYVNGLGLPNLQARVAAPTAGYPAGGATSPTTGNIHNKMVLVTVGGTGYLNISSINGSVELEQAEPGVRPADPVERRLPVLPGRVRLRLDAGLPALRRRHADRHPDGHAAHRHRHARPERHPVAVAQPHGFAHGAAVGNAHTAIRDGDAPANRHGDTDRLHGRLQRCTVERLLLRPGAPSRLRGCDLRLRRRHVPALRHDDPRATGQDRRAGLWAAARDAAGRGRHLCRRAAHVPVLRGRRGRGARRAGERLRLRWALGSRATELTARTSGPMPR